TDGALLLDAYTGHDARTAALLGNRQRGWTQGRSAARPADVLPHCEDPTVRAGAVPRPTWKRFVARRDLCFPTSGRLLTARFVANAGIALQWETVASPERPGRVPRLVHCGSAVMVGGVRSSRCRAVYRSWGCR